MLAALNVRAVVAGIAAGGLGAALVGLLVSGALVILNVDGGANIGLLAGVLSGMLCGGWVSGRMSVHSHRFHGSITGLMIAGFIILVASASAAPFSLRDLLLLALVGMVFGGAGGWLGGRQRLARK